VLASGELDHPLFQEAAMDEVTKTNIVETVQELVAALRNARRPNVPHRDAQAIQRGECLIGKLTEHPATRTAPARLPLPLSQWVSG
jgi:hypothetical protein